ncbi:MAG TPA: hypothetical protein DEW35_04120 [Ruminococcaceae bacterium]|nr:hypothetical protein [Oscillospiraceae bacterium]
MPTKQFRRANLLRRAKKQDIPLGVFCFSFVKTGRFEQDGFAVRVKRASDFYRKPFLISMIAF